MDRLNTYAGDTHKENGTSSIVLFLLGLAVVTLGFLVWATIQVSGL